MGVLLGAQRKRGDRVEVGRRHRAAHRLQQLRLPVARVSLDADPGGRRRGRLGGDQFEPGPVAGQLVDDGAVQGARQQELGKGNREEPPHLLRVAALRWGTEQARQAGDPLQRRQLGRLEGRGDGGGRHHRPPFELGEVLLGWRPRPGGLPPGALLLAVVEVDDAEQPLAREQGEPDRRHDLVAADEGAVDLGPGVGRDQRPAGDRQPDGRAVLLNAELVGNLALRGVGEVAAELLVHVGQRPEQGLLRLADRNRRVVAAARLLVEVDRDHLGARGALEVRDHAAEHCRESLGCRVRGRAH